MIESQIIETIEKKLEDIERRENVRILYACESGSRAWGFASPDSDYDVRFVYVRPMEDYLRLEDTRDVLEVELNEVYDINGWDVSKMLQLLTKSNPTIFEWADSPVVYKSTNAWCYIKSCMPQFFCAKRMLHYYVSIARKNIRRYFEGPEVSMKKYLYVIRGILACEWIMKKNCPPPTAFSHLVEETLPQDLNPVVQKLLDAKMKAGEKENGPHLLDLDAFIEQKIAESLTFFEQGAKEKVPNWELVDKMFLKILRKEV
ncbi:MAG: nucleotidyltransferase domain-containing protein [Treponemataceae bacterium]|nr:nucleotidyltransferase domain-containing protein [Treponemataceae bacterium]